MFQKGVHAESSTLTTRGSYSIFELSLRHRITATIIREEGAESLLPGIEGDAELAALNSVLNRYNAQWWLKHLSNVGNILLVIRVLDIQVAAVRQNIISMDAPGVVVLFAIVPPLQAGFEFF